MKEFMTQDPYMLKIMAQVRQIAKTNAHVLIMGESGTGKEVLAQWIHGHSLFFKQRLVAVNCAAIPENLLESELFGYEKGAFTGAIISKPGKFELASGSTILLDEISELPILLQSKLLRVIQEGEVERVGALKPRKVQFRLLATSNRNLREMVKDGSFREDLYYRLNVIPLTIPPLRARPLDIAVLTDHFLSKANELIKSEKCEYGIDIDIEAREKLMRWRWPGNVRELENVIQRAILTATNGRIGVDDIQIDPGHDESSREWICAGMTLERAESILIEKTLQLTENNRSRAADILGISVRTLRNKLNRPKEDIVNL